MNVLNFSNIRIVVYFFICLIFHLTFMKSLTEAHTFKDKVNLYFLSPELGDISESLRENVVLLVQLATH